MENNQPRLARTTAFARRAARWAAIGTALAATLAAPLALSTTAAAAPVPVTPTFTAPVDPYPKWTSEQGCLAGVRPGILATIEKVLKPTYGGESWRYLTQRTCVPSSESGHDNGTSLDWMNRYDQADEKARVEAFIGWLLATDQQGNPHANARRLGLMYLIWNDKVFKLYRSSAGWTTYTRSVAGVRTPCSQLQAASYDTVCHRDHLHLSFAPAGANMLTSYWKQAGVAPVTTSTLAITNTVINSTPGKPITLRGTTVKAGEQVQVYIRRPGSSTWIAILNPALSDASKQFSVTYAPSITHYVQVRVGTATSNIGRVILS